MFSTPTRHRLLAATAGLALAAGLIACGGDDSSDDTTSDDTTEVTTEHTEHPDETTADTTATGDADLAALCDAYTAASAAIGGAADPSQAGAILDELAVNPPAQIAGPTQTFVDGFKAALDGSDPAAIETAEFTSALGYVGGYYFDNCELSEQISVTGADYEFGGLPSSIAAGRVGIQLVNISEGNEPHELVLMRRPDGDTRTVEEIRALDPDTLFGEYQMAGVAWTNVPSAQMSILLDLEAGEYVAICNLPTEGDEADPHANHGMIAELSVA
jgi:hypothetical protein